MNLSNSNSHNVNLIFSRLKLFHGLNSDFELAKLLGLNQSTLSMQKRRGSIDLHAVLNVSEGIDLNWLFKTPAQSNSADNIPQTGTEDSKEYFNIGENELIEEVIRLRKKIKELESKLG